MCGCRATLCKMPIGSRNAQDKQIWNVNRHGKYTVRSGYHVAQARKKTSIGGSSREATAEEKWRKTWKMKVPDAIKHSLWRVGIDSLHTKYLLCNRKITENSNCLSCQSEEETIMHALRKCTGVYDVWAKAGISVQKWASVGNDFIELWDKLSQALETVSILRSIWYRRNRVVFENEFESPTQVIKTTIVSLNEYQETLNMKEGKKSSEGKIGEKQKWKKPEDGPEMLCTE